MPDDQAGNRNSQVCDLFLIAVRRIIAVFRSRVHDRDNGGTAGILQLFRLLLIRLCPVSGERAADAQESDPEAFIALPDSGGVCSEPTDSGAFQRSLRITVSRISVVMGMVIGQCDTFHRTQPEYFRVISGANKIIFLFHLGKLPV